MDLADRPARRRLSTALENLSATFRGMTARPEEHNCECHWGSPEELSLLKTPDVELEPDLLRRAWQATGWTDHAAVLRRILPQFATVLVAGRANPLFGLEEAGDSFARARWQQWPAEQADCVREFLHAWWVESLTDPDAAVPAHQVFVMCAEASGTLGPWLADWQEQTGYLSDQRLAEAAAEWEYELLGENLPWYVDWYEHDEEELRAELVAWLLGHAAMRLRESGASEDLQHRIRLLGLTGEDRWTDPHWPGHRY
ncbi:hypothetical protein [Streptomyces caniscabiei]|uniref:Uncharacterized protein n=1 Tax=Streptomyces caniscabiei TaxID=2746961 RepID=A0A927L7S7_9ACTN|nr:hypothetical protein [Streptomyces caniscabiei]MBD9703620.1 hypothetical protein [Streptomyces caniscabiei]MBD9726618.1 hypothetical protein [Streptomyces caniscabiei]MDX3514819.1 hypothetical protein [Streptomyces caniscabiei]MDX3723792.1 hypothetical protein [Streptomyces caniscabiei]MDX3731415.1 hypothetical protein [Streptomyces caniscabiei]